MWTINLRYYYLKLLTIKKTLEQTNKSGWIRCGFLLVLDYKAVKEPVNMSNVKEIKLNNFKSHDCFIKIGAVFYKVNFLFKCITFY